LMLLRLGRPSKRLIKCARESLDGNSDSLPIEIAALVLGYSGRRLLQKRVARNFAKFAENPIKQRLAIIALHQLDWVGDLEKVMRNAVHESNLGQLLAHVREFRGVFVSPIREVQLRDLASEPSEYV
jgi:hypothetical protein